MKRTFVGLSLVLALAILSVPTVLSAPASAGTGDRTVSLTMNCKIGYCSAAWQWFQGGVTGTQLGSGSMLGSDGNSTGTTIQPAAADTVSIQLSVNDCRSNNAYSFTPGSAINITVKWDIHKNYTFCVATFNMKS